MKKLLIIIFVMLGMVTSSWASSYTGSLSVASDTLIPEDWNDAVFSWTVDDITNPCYWTYDYEWSSGAKDLSHIDIEVSETFDFDYDLISWDSHGMPIAKVEGPQTFNEKYGSIFAIKWELNENTTSFHLTLVSTRMPMWGDIYAKDGSIGGDIDIYAINSKFGIDTSDPIGDGNNEGWALVPNSAVPIPSAVWLLGSGLIGIVGIRRKFKK